MSVIVKIQFLFCYLNDCVNGILFSPISCIVSNEHISVREVFKCTALSVILTFLRIGIVLVKGKCFTLCFTLISTNCLITDFFSS